MTLKAYNGRCVLSWLSSELLKAVELHFNNDMLVLVSSCMTLRSESFCANKACGTHR